MTKLFFIATELCCAWLLSCVLLFATPWTVGSSVHGDSGGKNTKLVCSKVLSGIQLPYFCSIISLNNQSNYLIHL